MVRDRLSFLDLRDSRRKRHGGLTDYAWAAEFDAHQFESLFQDDALTTKVTANAQAVGGWVNRGSAGDVLVQVGTNARPTYYTSLFNSAYPGVSFVTDDWMSVDFGSALWTDAEYWCVFVGVLPTFTGSVANPWHFDAAAFDATPSRWGNQDLQPSTVADRLDLYPQTTLKFQVDNRPLAECVYSIVVGPSGANNITVKRQTTSGGAVTTLTNTQTVARDLRAIYMGARHSAADTVDRIVPRMDVNYWAVMDYTNFPGAVAEEAYMAELLRRIGL